MTTKTKVELEMDSIYSESEIKELGLQPLNGHKMDYLIFEKDAKVYFFEKADIDSFRLFCCTSRQSFYLS